MARGRGGEGSRGLRGGAGARVRCGRLPAPRTPRSPMLWQRAAALHLPQATHFNFPAPPRPANKANNLPAVLKPGHLASPQTVPGSCRHASLVWGRVRAVARSPAAPSPAALSCVALGHKFPTQHGGEGAKGLGRLTGASAVAGRPRTSLCRNPGCACLHGLPPLRSTGNPRHSRRAGYKPAAELKTGSRRRT